VEAIRRVQRADRPPISITSATTRRQPASLVLDGAAVPPNDAPSNFTIHESESQCRAMAARPRVSPFFASCSY
jgi:hypothetical protein